MNNQLQDGKVNAAIQLVMLQIRRDESECVQNKHKWGSGYLSLSLISFFKPSLVTFIDVSIRATDQNCPKLKDQI